MARRARDRGVKVLLTGEGADELFAGYPLEHARAELRFLPGVWSAPWSTGALSRAPAPGPRDAPARALPVPRRRGGGARARAAPGARRARVRAPRRPRGRASRPRCWRGSPVARSLPAQPDGQERDERVDRDARAVPRPWRRAPWPQPPARGAHAAAAQGRPARRRAAATSRRRSPTGPSSPGRSSTAAAGSRRPRVRVPGRRRPARGARRPSGWPAARRRDPPQASGCGPPRSGRGCSSRAHRRAGRGDLWGSGWRRGIGETRGAQRVGRVRVGIRRRVGRGLMVGGMRATAHLRRDVVAEPAGCPPGWRAAPPDFVGVGVYRSGTSWWYRMMLDHPAVEGVRGARRRLRRGERLDPSRSVPALSVLPPGKELRFFDPFVEAPLLPGQADLYGRFFPGRRVRSRASGARTTCRTSGSPR